MGRALAEAAIARGHEVVVVTGPVDIEYPPPARVVPVVSTEEMLAATAREFDHCDGLIGAAAPCDYRPVRVADQKIRKTGQGVDLHLVETEDVVATCGARKGNRWVVGFALETEDHRLRALAKLERKHCDLVVSNSAAAIASLENSVEVLASDGTVLATLSGPKEEVAAGIFEIVDARLIASGSLRKP